jgi:hypothetical protein
MKRGKKKEQGFSFAETIITAGLIAFILAALAVLYSNFSKFYNHQKTEIEISDSAREAMKQLRSIVLQADGILASHSFSGTTYATDQHTVVLEIPSIDGSGDIVDEGYDYAVFYTTGNSLYKRVLADASSSRSSGTNEISDAVLGIDFTYDNVDVTLASEIDTDLQMETTYAGETASFDLQQTLYLRNK